MKKTISLETGTILAGLSLSLVSARLAGAGELNVPADYPTIQAAVDASSSNDVIHLAPGVYLEQVTIIRKKLTLLGAPGAVMRAQAGMAATLTAYHFGDTAAILGTALSDVVVKGITFEGEHLAETFPDASYCAMGLSGSTGRVEDCAIRGFRNSNAPFGFLNAFGILAANDTLLNNQAVDVQVLRCTLADNAASIIVNGALFGDVSPPRLNFAIQDNVIDGIGPVAGTQVGILIGAGATGDVSRNRIGNHYNAQPGLDITYSFGIYAIDWLVFIGSHTNFSPLQPVRYEGNTLVSNQLHLASSLGHGSQFVNNIFQGTGGTNCRLGGFALSGNTNRVIGNAFSDMPTGLTLIGDDPFFGTAIGIATNTALTSNRFCNVAAPIVTQRLASGTTNLGTLLCPFPPPALSIAPAVLLSWPGYTDGWLLDSAPTLNGPWTPTGRTPSLEGGQNTVAVTTDNECRFFRLRSP